MGGERLLRERLEMKKLIMAILLATVVAGCDKGADSRGAMLEADGKMGVEIDANPLPGYDEAKLICTQCHALPSPDQFHPAVWPSIVTRMEGHIRANNKILSSDKERVAILAYLQSSTKWK